MKKLPLKEIHRAVLTEYGLQNIPPEDCCCLHFSAGEEIQREGVPINNLSVIVKGSAKVCSTAPNGKSLILCYGVSAGLIGELELMTGQETATTTVVAITGFECVAINYQDCIRELKTNVLLLNKIGCELAGKLSRSSDNFTLAALCSGEQRLCSYILQTTHGRLFNDTLTDVSSSVGMSYRHMFRLLGQLCEDGVLEKRESGYFILKEDELVRRSFAVTANRVS